MLGYCEKIYWKIVNYSVYKKILIIYYPLENNLYILFTLSNIMKFFVDRHAQLTKLKEKLHQKPEISLIFRPLGPRTISLKILSFTFGTKVSFLIFSRLYFHIILSAKNARGCQITPKIILIHMSYLKDLYISHQFIEESVWYIRVYLLQKTMPKLQNIII